MPKESYRITFNSFHAVSGDTNDYYIDITPMYHRLQGKKCKFYIQSHIMESDISNNTIVYLNIDVGQSGSIQSNGTATNINNSKALLPYQGPAPPAKTGKHRYIFELYKQTEMLNVEPLTERSIPINSLRNKLNLSKYISKIQFISQNESGGKHKKTKKRKRNNKKTKKRNS
jgi:hypothetical protein